MNSIRNASLLLGACCVVVLAWAGTLGAGDRLAHLHERAPFYVHADFPKLTTPQWYGEDGVDAVIVLSIDDLSQPRIAHYRDFLQPVLDRMRELRGSSPLTIFANTVEPDEPQLQTWREAGVLLDVHTRSHPCPLMGRGLEGASEEVLSCLENLNRIPGHRAVGFRMPCCDSINSTTPIFFTEIFPRRAPDGSFLEIDSSVPVLPSPDFAKYAPFERYGLPISGYPYPYVVARLAWELPIAVPTDWQGQHLRGVCHDETVADIERGIDIVVRAKGIYNWCFHPHGWIRNDQIAGVVERVHEKYGDRVRFATTVDVLERLSTNLLGGERLRAADGQDNGVRLLDVNDDGFLDVVVGNARKRICRVWDPGESRYRETPFPFEIVKRDADDIARDAGVRFGVLRASGAASALELGARPRLAHFEDAAWREAPAREVGALGVNPSNGALLRDADGDGLSDLLLGDETRNVCFLWREESGFERRDDPPPFPSAACIADASGHDRGLRFQDLDGDGHDDLILSNDDEYFVYLFEVESRRWSGRVIHGPASAPGALPKFVTEGRDLGAWFLDGALYSANEHTTGLPNLVDVRHFDVMLEHKSDPPLAPRESMETFRVPEGFRVELFAAEPDVADPVAVAFGADGRVWVAEMAGYPLGLGADAGGRIRVLRDDDGDGRADSSTVFARGFKFPNGVLPHGEGVLVTAAPDIIYLEDRDGDGRADERRVVFTGFGEGNHQHRVNGLHYGIDNWIRGANGDSGGTIRSVSIGAVSINGRDFRFTADLSRFEAVSGRTQFGLAMDDFGESFGSSNVRHIMHAVLPESALRRNPYVAPPDVVLDIAEHGAMAKVFQTSKHLLTLNAIHVPNHFSSACGISIYRDELFPEAYRGNAFVAEPVGNLVHRDVLEPSGATFVARRGHEASEFLTATDSWFRPVFTTTGPDGALWVVDMYRWVIEHPQYIPEHIQQVLDFTAGRDRGRIYRVTREDAPARRPAPLDGAAPEELVRALESPGGWHRDAAQRLLVTRAKADVAPALERLARESERAATRVHALWTLEGLGALEAKTVLAALEDGHARVREHALRLAERFVNDDAIGPAIRHGIVARASDDDFRVRLQAAMSLGEMPGDDATKTLAALLIRDGGDLWMRVAVLSSTARRAVESPVEPAPTPSPESTKTERAALERLRKAIAAQSGDAARGRKIFVEKCSTCHRLGGLGTRVGPDLEDARAKPADVVLESIVNPGNMAPPKYRPYVVIRKSGDVSTGLIASESATAISLIRAGGVTEDVLRIDIRELRAAGASFMPDDFARTLTDGDFADLLAFLRAAPGKVK